MVYILEDEDPIRNLLEYALNNTPGLKAKGFSCPSEFWKAIKEEAPSLLLLDIMLPEEDGLQILGKLRSDSRYASMPIIMLTAKGSEYDRVTGLDAGADDYITKPFSVMEVIARINALLRRTSSNKSVEYSIGGLYVNISKHIVTANGKEVQLTYKEFELLCLLLGNIGVVLSREKILENVWGYNFDGESRTVDVHIRTLRMKLGDCGSLIETVRGMGYKFSDAR